jgi:hypothetical protein
MGILFYALGHVIVDDYVHVLAGITVEVFLPASTWGELRLKKNTHTHYELDNSQRIWKCHFQLNAFFMLLHEHEFLVSQLC